MISDPYVIVTCDHCGADVEEHWGESECTGIIRSLRHRGWQIEGNGHRGDTGSMYCCVECHKAATEEA